MMQPIGNNGLYLIYDADCMYLFVHHRLVNQYFSSYGLDYIMTERCRMPKHTKYEIFLNSDCAVAFKELSRFSEIKKLIISPDNLNNTLSRRYPDYTEWYQQEHQEQIEEQSDWTDCYLGAHHQQQAMIEEAIKKYQPPFDILDQIPFDKAFSHFQHLLDELPWEYSELLECCDSTLYDSIFYDLPQRLIKKRIWLGTAYLLYELQRIFHISRQPTQQNIDRGKAVFDHMLSLANYDKVPVYHDIEKYDFYPMERLAKMLESNKVCFSQTA